MPLALRIMLAVLLPQPVVGVHLDLRCQGAAVCGTLFEFLSFCHLDSGGSVRVLDLPHLLPAILELQCSCVVGKNMYGSHEAWAGSEWVLLVCLNCCGWCVCCGLFK